MHRFWTFGVLAAVIAACGGDSTPTASPGVATNGGPLSNAASPSGSAGAQTSGPQVSGLRTVLTPIGLNVRAQPGVASARVGTAAQGTVFSVIGHSAASGGWYQVKGSSVTGWISDDSSLTSAQALQQYSSASHAFNALYRQDWTFQDASTAVTFLPQHGTERLVVTGAAALAKLPTPQPGTTVSTTEVVVVCGITTVLRTYTGGSVAAGATVSTVNVSTGTIAFQASLQYDQPAQLIDLRDFYNSMSFTAPQCLAPAAPPSP